MCFKTYNAQNSCGYSVNLSVMSRHVPHWIVHSIHLFIMSQTRKNLTFYISTQGIYHQFYAWCFFHHDHIDCTCSHMITFNATRIFFVCWYTKLLFGNMVGTTKSDKIPNILQVKFIASIVVAICARNKEVLLILNLSIKYVTHKYDIISRYIGHIIMSYWLLGIIVQCQYIVFVQY